MTSLITVDFFNNSITKTFDDLYDEYIRDPMHFMTMSELEQSLINDTNSIIERLSQEIDNSTSNPLTIRIKTAIKKLALKTDPLMIVDNLDCRNSFMINRINKLKSPDISDTNEFKYLIDLILCILPPSQDEIEIQLIRKLINRLEYSVNKN